MQTQQNCPILRVANKSLVNLSQRPQFHAWKEVAYLKDLMREPLVESEKSHPSSSLPQVGRELFFERNRLLDRPGLAAKRWV